MRKLLLLLAAAICSLGAHAQVGTFESLPLPTADTYYVNYSAPGKDVGFNDGAVHYPCVYDTSGGVTFLSSGFVYSNKRDSVTSGYQNQFSAKPAAGYLNSSKYAVAYGQVQVLKKTSPFQWSSVAIANSTYAYNSMRDGDAFAKKFGGVTGNDPDSFVLFIRGFRNGTLTQDFIHVYLANFLYSNNSQDYILKGWQLVNLSQFGSCDSLQFTLYSSDNGVFGMNTPAYFCLDNMQIATEGINNVSFAQVAGIYPNPVSDFLHLDIKDASVKEATITDITGRLIADIPVKSARVDINTSTLPAGQYILKLDGNESIAATKFIKQ